MTFSADIRGIPVTVLRPADGGDYTLGGVSSTHARLTITGIVTPGTSRWAPLGELSRVFAPSEDAPEAWLYRRTVFGKHVWSVVPACAARQGAALTTHLSRVMFGGHYAHLGDSRLTELVGFYGAVAVHDRIEHPLGGTA
jgi:hypothetical protein